jgi:ABC-type multidrug transport system fused ATPase/permease subunit
MKGHIQFDRLRFSYTDTEIVLPDFSLDIRAGETIALVGHTGAGKSSVAKLVARFYEFQGGRLLIDGRDIRSLDLSEYRRHVGLVPQEPFLFTGTVRDNIRYSRPDVDDAAVVEAAMQIGRGDWLDALPNGLDTDVGERGSTLSMGQRQLVALARVVLKDPASSSWTKPPPAWIPSRKPRSRKDWRQSWPAGRLSSSRTVCRRSRTRTGSL